MNEAHRIMPFNRFGLRLASIMAMGPENDSPRIKKSLSGSFSRTSFARSL